MTPWKDMKMMLQLLRYEQAHDDSICMREWLKSLHAISQNEKVYLMEAVKTGKLKRSEAELVQRFTSYDEAQEVWRKRQEGEEYRITPSRPPSFGKQKDRQIYRRNSDRDYKFLGENTQINLNPMTYKSIEKSITKIENKLPKTMKKDL
jgi:hypothetical protein